MTLYLVPRTCTVYPEGLSPESHAIAFFRERDAYVLLGDPGAGKTTLFKKEAADTEGIYLTAREFLTFNRTEWHGKTLFIDGLDETRAGIDDARTPLDAIRGKLDQLGRPRFRLSCREADWLGGNDQTALNACASSGQVIVLHLNALTEADIAAILLNDQRVGDADVFMQKAKQYTLEGLLYNPQTLDMLIAAVQGNNWPHTKLDTYQLACQKMVLEHSDEHKAAIKKQTAPVESLLYAAGYLCAVQLLANASSFNEDDDTREGQVCLNAIKIPDNLPCDQALKTRLFKCMDGTLYEPVHRSVAEFLGARFLAKKIKEGMPLSRILALMTGFDGGVVAALRGLMSWLGALSLDARNHLIKIDPLGMVLYGDVQLFSTQTKQQLLSALRHEVEKNGYLRYDYRVSYPFAALTTQDMASQLLELLTNPSREKHDQQILSCILVGLYRSEPIEELKDAFIAIVRDQTYEEGIRVSALQAFIHQYPEDVLSMLALAEDFRTDKIADANERLPGILLTELFPRKIGATKILNYLKPTEGEGLGVPNFFWNYWLSQQIQDNDLPILLDEMVKFDINTFQQSQFFDWFQLAGQLLALALTIFGEMIDDDRLYDWLTLGLDEYQHPHLKSKHHEKIQAWLNCHPERYLALISVGVNRISNPANMNVEMHKIVARLYNASPPDNLGLWWLERALDADAKHQKDYFIQAWLALINGRGDKGLSLEFFENWIAEHNEFKEIYQSAIICELQGWQSEHAQSEKELAIMREKREKEKAGQLAYFRKYLSAIQDGSAHPAVLHDLANFYFAYDTNSDGKTGREQLANFLNNDENLIRAAINGMRKIFDRPDLPQTSEIFDLAVKQRRHYIRLPFLTCTGELHRENPAMLDILSDELAAKALAFWYTYGAGDEPDWVKPLSFSRPDLTAKVFIEYVSSMLAAKVQHIHGVYQLAHAPEYHEIARLVAIPLLEIYPVRANKQQASTLEYLLKAAISHGDKVQLFELIARKLSLKSLDVAQRVYWLAAGLVIAPESYLEMLKKYVSENVTRINHLSEFLHNGFHSQLVLPPATLSLIVELLAPRYTPHWPERTDSRVTRAMNEGDYVNSLLKRLSENPDTESAQAIEYLLSLPQLNIWHETLLTARQTQQINRREALFRHPNAIEVTRTLNNLKPANVADLAALAMDHLNKLSGEMRTSSTDSYKHFWNEDSYSRPTNPKTENSCRDYLAERLKARLSPLDVEVLLESHEANDKRADMRLSFHSNGNAFHLPVEIKLDHSPDLWRAIHEQLIPLYTLDPETQGRGLFLVIYFGDKNMPAPSSGKRPKTAAELQARLIASLTPQEQKLIDVFVLDVSCLSEEKTVRKPPVKQ
jgi:hypothetical protein